MSYVRAKSRAGRALTRPQPQALVQGSVVNIGSPALMAYDGRAALWGSPRAAAASSPAAPRSIQPPLSVVEQDTADGALLLQAGAYSLMYSTDATFQKVNTRSSRTAPSAVRAKCSRNPTSVLNLTHAEHV